MPTNLRPAVRKVYGPLTTHCVDGGPSPHALLVLCHGYGAPGTDLVSLAQPILEGLGDRARAWRCLFPSAPQDLRELGMPGGRAWWPINMQMLLQISATGSWDALRRQHPPGIDQASEQLVECIEAARVDLGCTTNALVIGGFSQGAMLSMHVAARGLGKKPDGLILYSGTLVCEEQWRTAARARFMNLPIVQSHGRWDSILPYAAAEGLRDLLIDADAELTFIPFDGDHTICQAAIDETTRLLGKLSSP